MNASTEVLTEFEIAETRRNMERANNEQRVYNEESFGPLASDAPIIVIQVHTRLTYLRHLIVSLAQAKGIEQTLLVFSHDVWHPDINYLVQSVDFCRVMQIFYPHSIQTHPRSFPGEDPNDCPRNIRKEQWVIIYIYISLSFITIFDNSIIFYFLLVFVLSQSSQSRLHQCQASGFIWTLQRSKIHADETSLVVESESCVRSIVHHQESHWYGSFPRGGSLRRRGFPARSQTDGTHL